MRRIAVYCGAATPANPIFMETAHAVGHELATRGIGLVYGGGRLGLMGAVTEGALSAGGEVIGVIPEALEHAEVAHKGLSELHIVQTMHERKAMFTDLSDGFVTLPGGAGTMDELWEAISWGQLGYHAKPVGLLNVAGFYNGLIQFWRNMGETGFIRPKHQQLLIVDETLNGLLAQMATWESPTPIIQMAREDL